MKIENDNRNLSIDILRGFAMAGIVLIHVHSYFAFFHSVSDPAIQITGFLANLSRFGVPVFILVAGYFAKPGRFLDFFPSKVYKIFIPYLLASVIGYYVKFEVHEISDFFVRVVTGTVFTPFYFIPLLFQFYILFFLAQRVFQKKWFLLGFLIVSLVATILSHIGILTSPWEAIRGIWIFDFLVFFILGIWIRENKKFDFLKNRFNNKYANILYFGLFLGLSVYAYYMANVLKIMLTNHEIIFSILSIIFWIGIPLPSILSKYFRHLGEKSLGVFLIHPFLIHFMHSFDPYILGGPYPAILITLLINTVVPIFIWSFGEWALGHGGRIKFSRAK
jgi:surface polysaccharide O-acyltransferase-like enzyme